MKRDPIDAQIGCLLALTFPLVAVALTGAGFGRQNVPDDVAAAINAVAVIAPFVALAYAIWRRRSLKAPPVSASAPVPRAPYEDPELFVGMAGVHPIFQAARAADDLQHPNWWRRTNDRFKEDQYGKFVVMLVVAPVIGLVASVIAGLLWDRGIR